MPQHSEHWPLHTHSHDTPPHKDTHSHSDSELKLVSSKENMDNGYRVDDGVDSRHCAVLFLN